MKGLDLFCGEGRPLVAGKGHAMKDTLGPEPDISDWPGPDLIPGYDVGGPYGITASPYVGLKCSCGADALIVEDGVGRCAKACARDAERGPHPAFITEDQS